MAEVVGVVSAGVGIAAFIVQITGNISRLKEIRDYNQNKAGDEIEFLVRRLEFLQNVLVSLQSYEGNPIVDIAIKNCQLEYSRVDDILQRVAETISRAQADRSKKWKTLVKPPEIGRDLNIAKERITGVIVDLTCSFTLVLHQTIPSQILAAGAHNSSRITDIESASEAKVSNVVAATTPTESNLGTLTASENIIRPNRRQPCSVKHCHCSCHVTGASSGRFWGFEYTPFSTFWRYCDNAQCSARRYRWSLRIALTQYGIPLTVITGLELVSGGVKYTSPGFETLKRFHEGLLDVSEAKRRFLELYRADPSLKHHVNPAGRDYMQGLFRQPGMHGIEGNLQMLDFFVRELGMSIGNCGSSFLMRHLLYYYQGWTRVDLLDSLLQRGLDPDGADLPAPEYWPAFAKCAFWGVDMARDPFHVHFLARIVCNETATGFGGLTPLHQAVLQQSVKTVVSLISQSTAGVNEKNFLGQTPLHLATPSLELVTLLYEAGHDINALDRSGATPLIYAGAMGNAEVVRFLIAHGANISITEKEGRNFFTYTSDCRRWSLVLDVLGAIRPHCSPEDFQCCEEANALVRCGFTGFNQPNSEGQTPIFSLIRYPDAGLLGVLLAQGTNINHVDLNGRSILSYLIEYLGFSRNIWGAMDSINVCVSGGSDIFLSDNCQCACSPGGYCVSSMFDLTFEESNQVAFVWGFEFLSLVEDERGLEESRKVLLSLLRATWAEKIGITHVCCNGEVYAASYLRDEPLTVHEVLEILDEEEELIEELNNKMCTLPSDSFENLRTKWMILLKEVFDDRSKAFESLNHPSRPPLEVDYKNDTFVNPCDNMELPPSLLTPIAEYLIWMEHEYVRRKAKVTSHERKAWYVKRLLWIVELMQVTDLDADEIVSAMQEQLDRWKDELPENLDGQRVINHFLGSMKAIDANVVK
ncbi:ankyrin repeat domain-containing protein [Aspergillus puulaauensis]|uniref:Ankyrin repeat-containing domain protein n=1 Tax=Aspergillus puulaauensis TaxID=1220207 RepID=A0A7R8AKD1_9EURO|nr:uncharacterized protein APUU_21909S [Aspergillus puulaauensis]BCS21477.1 hypothetical protein APUU_21909S [Aspergillus puulaauensis]